ncbi:MAG: class IV adenylate cyclase [Desulfobacteraceae bacterium]|nr:class IV adenylate cyclase [Desulfobacteraceae bacterium]MDH3573266.1 class IV adenylate cyclase [Desulfobacteraceae bacterium]MDH3720891.1 class IV adenylate cyclase [Desulfobacteraceae bacterium]MDH3835334.1 class IV adenylate cyclase [Desulfobacteraceae bacterium]MDH3873662.1 class IV adenylate cyclase [Desulfobacteraceae bacterium]
MKYLETEVKFYLPNIDPVRTRMIDLGAVYKDRTFETNIRFEDPEKSLIKKKSLLRLRKDKKITLTYKSEPPFKDNQFKILQEFEVEVSDFDAMEHILKSLGFQEEQIYEKWRETYILDDTHLCLDTMPYGDFIEIEGNKESIQKLASQIGFLWEKRILLNYLAIFDVIKRKLNLSFYDVTFGNFNNIRFDMTQYLNLIEADAI